MSELHEDPQNESPLFTKLPAEVRVLIYKYALATYPDPRTSERYPWNSCYVRPGHFSPHRTDTGLLETCRAVFREASGLLFDAQEMSWWLTDEDRAPTDWKSHYSVARTFRRALEAEEKRQSRQRSSEMDGSEVSRRGQTIGGLQVFAQLHNLPQVPDLFRDPFWTAPPRRFTVTIRHTDWFGWEEDVPLRLTEWDDINWVEELGHELSELTEEVVIELESVSRKKHQVDYIARHMCQFWYFLRQGRRDKTTDRKDIVWCPDASGKDLRVSRWIGPSSWDGNIWDRDEISPGLIEYYVVGVPFRRRNLVENTGQVSEAAQLALDVDELFDSLVVTAPEDWA